MAKATWSSLRMAAQAIAWPFLPLAFSRWQKVLMLGFYRHAVSAGRYSALRKAGSPVLEMRVFPTHWPDAWSRGARPT